MTRKFERHPWGDWFALGQFRLVRGVHYVCRTDTMAQSIRARAKLEGLAVRIAQADDGLSLLVTVKEASPCLN